MGDGLIFFKTTAEILNPIRREARQSTYWNKLLDRTGIAGKLETAENFTHHFD